MMDELVDILDSKGRFTGKTVMKSVAHRDGLFHNTVHVWFYTPDGKLLLQQRGKEKKIFPLLWDVSVAGHVAAGESIVTSAIREVKEEIGIVITANNLEKIGVFKSIQKHPNGLTDCEFHHTFLHKLQVPFEKLSPQKSEVASLKLMEVNSFIVGITEGRDSGKYVPHKIHYYKTVITAISKNL